MTILLIVELDKDKRQIHAIAQCLNTKQKAENVLEQPYYRITKGYSTLSNVGCNTYTLQGVPNQYLSNKPYSVNYSIQHYIDSTPVD